jgi:hypothetical protein
MAALAYRKHQSVSLKDHPQFNEAWLQDRIAEDPAILGLGDLELIDRERFQPKAGRLDLLLRDPDTGKRYEVELMLGTLDESHIIRTIEYWDIERKRFPQYDHCAVIVAETVNARFLNVIGLFNSVIPIMAIQLNALQVEESIVLNFTKVLDEIALGLEEEETGSTQVTDRNYWETRNVKGGLALTDKFFQIIQTMDSDLSLNYVKNYIGIARKGSVSNFMSFHPKQKHVNIRLNKVSDPAAWRQRLTNAGFDVLEIRDNRVVRFSVRKSDFEEHIELLKELMADGYKTWFE